LRLAAALALAILASPALAAPDCRAPAELIDVGTPLPRLARALAEGRVPVVVALGSSSTQGTGASRPGLSYPSRLAEELRQRHGVALKVLNMGIGGETTSDMLRRFERDVLRYRPDLVVWQVGSNTAVRHIDPGAHYKALEAGVVRLRGAGIDVVLMSPQYAPRVIASPRHLEILVELDRLAAKTGSGVFRRFEIMRSWFADGVGFETMLSPDGLHMNDWSYGCLARLLADAIAAKLKP
jgi:acyl-CoA thioesterase I